MTKDQPTQHTEQPLSPRVRAMLSCQPLSSLRKITASVSSVPSKVSAAEGSIPELGARRAFVLEEASL